MQTEDFSSHNVQYNWQYTSYLFNFHMNSNKFALGTMIAKSDHVITQITELCCALTNIAACRCPGPGTAQQLGSIHQIVKFTSDKHSSASPASPVAEGEISNLIILQSDILQHFMFLATLQSNLENILLFYRMYHQKSTYLFILQPY